MPFFHFNIEDGDSLIADVTGMELATLELVRIEAVRTAADFGRDHAPGRDWSVTVHVQDAAQTPIMSVTASMKIEHLAGKADVYVLHPAPPTGTPPTSR